MLTILYHRCRVQIMKPLVRRDLCYSSFPSYRTHPPVDKYLHRGEHLLSITFSEMIPTKIPYYSLPYASTCMVQQPMSGIRRSVRVMATHSRRDFCSQLWESRGCRRPRTRVSGLWAHTVCIPAPSLLCHPNFDVHDGRIHAEMALWHTLYMLMHWSESNSSSCTIGNRETHPR